MMLAVVACGGNEIIPAPEEVSDPEFTVTGLTQDSVNSNSSFILKVSSLSDGYIDFKSSDESVARISMAARREYKVSAGEPSKDTPVTITFVQEASGKYPETKYEIDFTVLGEDWSIGPTVPSEPHEDLDGVKVTFTESVDPLVNPERGLYRSLNFNSTSGPLNVSEVKARRAQGFSLFYMGFYLTDFMDGDISESFLEMFQSSMDALREGGAKCLLRFAYKNYSSDKEDMDPEVDVVLRHVEQLKPYLQKNADVIFVLQAGFVGPWGEWHSSTHFGTGYEFRKKLADALLDAMPESRQIQVRTPQFKMRMYGYSVKDTLTAVTAHDGSTKSRIAGHNDCFGASINDSGTFDNETADREYWKAETRYIIMGGETCKVSQYCLCRATINDVRDYHWTCLNVDYNSDVLKRWKSADCYNTIAACLGYRLVMQDLFYSEDLQAGKACNVVLRFYNTGVAAPMNPRDAVLVWVSDSGKAEEFPIDSDPRTWHSGYHSVSATFTPSSDKGTLYLKLSDPLLRDRAEYSIALANEGVFDSETGLNKLFEVK